MSPRLLLRDVGQLKCADVTFGDLTVLVGAQATGKSIFLQFLKLMTDSGHVLGELKRHGMEWERNHNTFLDVFLGEGMHRVWRDASALQWAGREVRLDALISRQKANKEETLFFVPAQRVLTLGKGWPRPFTDYSPGDPFTVRDFSEKIRRLMEADLGRSANIFPQTRRLKTEYRRLIAENVFHEFGLNIDTHGIQKRLTLSGGNGGAPLPFMVWSAGQREFVPLLLALYWLLPPSKVTRRDRFKWVVIEEPEMGLHPRAVAVMLLLILELLSRDYRVCVSTHSAHVLDLVWALRILRAHAAEPASVLELCGAPNTQALRRVAETVLKKESRVYLFSRETGTTQEISDLDPGAGDAAEAEWGGLTEFSGRAADVVAEVVAGADPDD